MASSNPLLDQRRWGRVATSHRSFRRVAAGVTAQSLRPDPTATKNLGATWRMFSDKVNPRHQISSAVFRASRAAVQHNILTASGIHCSPQKHEKSDDFTPQHHSAWPQRLLLRQSAEVRQISHCCDGDWCSDEDFYCGAAKCHTGCCSIVVDTFRIRFQVDHWLSLILGLLGHLLQIVFRVCTLDVSWLYLW